MTPPRSLPVFAAVAFAAATVTAQQQAPPKDDRQSFRFRSAVELINVTTTVTDSNGRFVSDLRQEDFRVFEDGQEQPITHFSNERVPVSLGIALDTSLSMNGEKMSAARDALRRFLGDLLDPADEVFLYRFSNVPELVEGWTTNRDRLLSRLSRIWPEGGTAMYDAVADACRSQSRAGIARRHCSSSPTATANSATTAPRSSANPRVRGNGLRDWHRQPERNSDGPGRRTPRQPPPRFHSASDARSGGPPVTTPHARREENGRSRECLRASGSRTTAAASNVRYPRIRSATRTSPTN